MTSLIKTLLQTKSHPTWQTRKTFQDGSILQFCLEIGLWVEIGGNRVVAKKKQLHIKCIWLDVVLHGEYNQAWLASHQAADHL